MEQERQPLTDNTALPWLGLVIVLVFVIGWTIITHSQSALPTPGTQPTGAAAAAELKVESGNGSTSATQTANPQQTDNPSQNAPSSVQSGQPNLQPAQTNSEQLRQQSGL